MTEPVTGIVLNTGASAAIDGLRPFFERLLGPAADEAGQMLADSVRSYRLRNQIKLLSKSKAILEEAGISPTQVPLRTLVPLLDGATLEDDPVLQELWANLLANAAAGTNNGSVPPAYPEILRQLSPLDALILSSGLTKWGYPRPTRDPGFYVDRLELSESHLNLASSITNLERLGIVVVRNGVAEDLDEIETAVERLYHAMVRARREGRLRDPDFRNHRNRPGTIGLTPLGVHFLSSCLPPVVLPLRDPVGPSSDRSDLTTWHGIAEGLAKDFVGDPRLANAFKESAKRASKWLFDPVRSETNR